MQIEYAKNPQWVNAEHTLIDLTVKFSEFAEEVPFTASNSAAESYTNEIFNQAMLGNYGVIAEYQEPEVTTTTSTTVSQVAMRQMRLALHARGILSSVDSAIAQIADSSLREVVQIEWEYATVIKRTASWFQTLAEQLNVVGEDLDNLFLEASTL